MQIAEFPQNQELLLKKVEGLKSHSENFQSIQKAHQFLNFNFHKVPLRIYSTNKKFLNEIRSTYPDSWFTLEDFEDPIELIFSDPLECFKSLEDFEDERQPEIFYDKDNIIQRDFCAKEIHKKKYFIFCELELTDGFFNFLRWKLPNELLKKNKLLLHSGAVHIQNNGIIFLGKSGHGKSTTCNMISKKYSIENVINDDMNILCIVDKEPKVYPAGLGGLFPLNKKHLNSPVNLSAVYWLNKSNIDEIEKVSTGKMMMFLLASITSINWATISEQNQNLIFERLTTHLNKNIRYGILHLRKGVQFIELINK